MSFKVHKLEVKKNWRVGGGGAGAMWTARHKTSGKHVHNENTFINKSYLRNKS